MHVTIEYFPRAPFVAFHLSTKRWGVLVVHRRAGKTVAGVNQLVRGALTCGKPAPRFGYLAPYRQQAKMVAWDYLKLYTKSVPGRKVSESELYVEFPAGCGGGRVSLYGADNYDALRGIYLDGAVVDEPVDMAPEVWTDFLRPALSDRVGWCVWIGTPKGRNAFFRLYDAALKDPEYFTMLLKASESGILPADELLSAKKHMGEDSFNREYECSFAAAVPGAIWGGVISQLRNQRRIVDFLCDQAAPLYTFWDLGRSDYTCIWLIQMIGKDINLLDFYSAKGQGPGHYAEVIAQWEKRHGRSVKAHYLPHDAEHEDRQGGTWRGDLLHAGLEHLNVVFCTPDKWRGIHRLTETLLPRCWIHATNCSKTFGTPLDATPSGLDCLEYYSRRELNENGIISEEPLHDEYSHGADALRTFSEAYATGTLGGDAEVALESRRGHSGPRTALRGPSESSYPFSQKRQRLFRVIR
ncbi:MAG: hypothetical protein ABSA72_09545 [Nitrososphaerales archaeon]